MTKMSSPNLFLCAVLIGIGSLQVGHQQCGSLPSSGPPILESDTVGQLPANQTSKRLQKLFRRASSSTALPIRFTQLPTEVNNTSLVTATKAEYIVALGKNLDHEEEENAIAHELYHIILQSKGFAAEVHTPEGAPPLMMTIGSTITSCVDDAVIDRRMAKLGFKPELLNHDAAQQMRLNPPNFSPDLFNDPVFRDGNALLIVCYSFRKKYRNDEIETAWKKLYPGVVTRAHILAGQIGDITCEDAATCLVRKKKIRDVLGYPITFCNPTTMKYE